MKQPFDWTNRIEMEIASIQSLMSKRISKTKKEEKLQQLLAGLISDVEGKTRDQLTNRPIYPANHVGLENMKEGVLPKTSEAVIEVDRTSVTGHTS